VSFSGARRLKPIRQTADRPFRNHPLPLAVLLQDGIEGRFNVDDFHTSAIIREQIDPTSSGVCAVGVVALKAKSARPATVPGNALLAIWMTRPCSSVGSTSNSSRRSSNDKAGSSCGGAAATRYPSPLPASRSSWSRCNRSSSWAAPAGRSPSSPRRRGTGRGHSRTDTAPSSIHALPPDPATSRVLPLCAPSLPPGAARVRHRKPVEQWSTFETNQESRITSSSGFSLSSGSGGRP